MANILIQELCDHINKLESDCERLQATLYKYHTLFHEICRISGCETWSSFLDWVFSYFKHSPTKASHQESQHKYNNYEPILKFQKELISYGQLPSIEEQIESMTSKLHFSEKSLEELLKASQINPENISISKIVKNDSGNGEFSLSATDYIIIENTRLRKENSELNIHLQKLKESLQSMMYVLKDHQSGRLIRSPESTYTSIVSLN